MRGLTSLHQAVIDDDRQSVSQLSGNEELCNAKDDLGFTPLELAQLLGRTHCQKLLGGMIPAAIKLQFESDRAPRVVSIHAFEGEFDIAYRSFLRFDSYHILNEVIRNCPYILRSAWLASENHEWASLYKNQLSNGTTAPIYIKWIDARFGYGAFADADIPENTFVGEYTGLVRHLYRRKPDPNGYCLRYPTKFWCLKYFVVDALNEGNVTRFINHSDQPNLKPICIVDRGLLHQAFISISPISKDTQLTFDYGSDYWIRRKKV